MNLYTIYMQKEIFIFEKIFWPVILRTPAPFDELKFTPESYFVSPFFLWTLQKHSVFPWHDFC